MSTETPPGFVLTTISNKVKFVTAFQNGEFSPELENLTDWTELMEIVGHSFDTLDDLGDVEESIQEDIISWLGIYEQVHSGIFNIKVSVEERGYFEDDVAGKKKYVGVNFNDQFKTQVVFFVTRIRKMETLRELAAEAVANEVKNDEKIHDLEIPNFLKDDVLANCRSQWTKRWQRRTLERVREENRLKMEHIKKLLINLRLQ